MSAKPYIVYLDTANSAVSPEGGVINKYISEPGQVSFGTDTGGGLILEVQYLSRKDVRMPGHRVRITVSKCYGSTEVRVRRRVVFGRRVLKPLDLSRQRRKETLLVGSPAQREILRANL